ncbi:MAG: RNA chaperone Hfq [Bacillota bacterium]|nr:RNA chaperone Hfq [Bacillota bacterium]
MSKSQANLQDALLNQIRRENLPVTVYLVNGVQLKGYVRGFDSFTVVLENDGKQLMVYKHAMSTVSPARPVELPVVDRPARDSELGISR